MGTTLHTLAPNPGATKKRKRVGRGPGSGYGKTAGRGQKGQKARSGSHGAIVGFEGGQMPMQRRLPKRGFTNQFRIEAYPVNVGVLDRFDGEVGIDELRAAGLVPKKAKVVKILGNGEVTKGLTVRAHKFSKSAVTKLEAAGGKAEVISRKVAKPQPAL
ncbi:MAG: 50S ribosomal protein L15 [Deltaproteobacteria bacterium]|nr:50S ribosomal protein L15 [Deltaproteobacteria bacterium]